MKTDDIIRLQNIIDSFSLEEISRKLQEIAADIRSEDNTLVIVFLKNEQHLLSLARAFKTRANSELTQTAEKMLEKMAYWFSEQTTLENYRALALHCFNLYFLQNIPRDINPLDIIVLGKAFIAEPLKYTGYLFWLLENNLNPRDIDDSRITQNFFAYHAFDLEVIKNTYQFFENVSEKTVAFLHYFNETSSQMRGFINSQINHTFRSYNVLGTQYDHPQAQIFYHTNFESIFSETLYSGLNKNNILSLYELFDWTLIESLNLEIHSHQLIIEYILQHPNAEKFLISFSEFAVSGKVSLTNALGIIEKIKKFWIENNALANDRKINLINTHPFLIHTLIGNINLVSHLESSLEAFQQRHYQTLTHLPYLCKLYLKIPESLFFQEKYKSTLIKNIFNLISEYGSTLPNDALSHIQTVPLAPLFREFLNNHQQMLTEAITQLLSDNADFETVENIWGNQLSMVNLAIHLFPAFKDQIHLPYDKYDLYCAVADKIAELEPLPALDKFRQFLALHQHQVGLPRTILQETLIRTKAQSTRALILSYIGLDEAFIDFMTQPMLNKKSVLSHATRSSNFDLIAFILGIAENTPLLDKIQQCMIDCLNEIINPFEDFLKAVHSQKWNLISTLLPHLKNNERFIALIKSVLAEAIKKSYNSFIIFLLSKEPKEHISFLTTQFITQTLLEKKNFFNTSHQETVLLLCGMKTETLSAPGIIIENNLALYFSVIQLSITQVSELQHTNTPIVYDDMATLFHDERMHIVSNRLLTACDERKNNILHLAAHYGDFQNLKMIFEALEAQEENDEIFNLLKEKNRDGNIPCSPGDDPVAREINAYLKRQYDRYEQLHRESRGSQSSSSANNENTFFQGGRKRGREAADFASQLRTIFEDDDTNDDDSTNDSESDFQADTLNILN